MADGELFVGMADGHMLRSADEGESWQEIGARIAPITAVAATG
jgi:hypothetical protein